MSLDPNKVLQEAIEILQKNKKDVNKAESLLNTIYSYYELGEAEPEVLANIGTVNMIKGNYGIAINFYKQAIYSSNHPGLHSLCYNNIGICDREKAFIVDDLRIIKNAKKAFAKAHELNSKDVDSLINLGCMSVANGEPEEAIRVLSKAIEISPEHPNARWNRALAYLEIGDFRNGWVDYEYGKRTDDRNKRTYGNLPDWDGSDGRTIIVYGEQGIGDEIMWASMIPELSETNTVILDCHPRLQDLFRNAFPDVKVYGTRKERECYWPKYYDVDCCIAIGSLGQYLRNDLEDFPKVPYLKADPIISAKYKDRLNKLSNKKKIGISWRGGTTKTGELYRKIDLEKWVDLFKEDFDFVSLQYRQDAEEDIAKFNEKYPGYKIHHWRETVDDYDETAGLIDNLDLIISVPQSIIHLAGAMGVKTIQLTPIRSLWQMGKYGEDLPWYSSVKSLWQPEHGNWETVMKQAKDYLCSL